MPLSIWYRTRRVFFFSGKQDNSERYRDFADAYKEVFMDMKPSERKKAMDNEWVTKWKNVVDEDEFK